MRFIASIATAVVAAAALQSCAVAPVQTRAQVENPQVIAASRDAVWGTTLGILAEKGLPIATVEKESGLISTGTIEFRGVSKLAEPLTFWEQSGASVMDEGRYRLTIIIQEVDPANTSVTVSPYIEAFSGQWLHKKSLGVVEEQFFEGLRKRVAVAESASAKATE